MEGYLPNVPIVPEYCKLDTFLMSIEHVWFAYSKMIALKPLPGRVLVELREKYQNVATPDQKYDTKTSGVCVDMKVAAWDFSDRASVDDLYNNYASLKGKLVFWEEYKDGAVIERDGKKYAFIKIKDLDGYEDVQS